ncbi:5-formyltetrahydrofolate cyclo-ligase [Streptomyces spiramenti]|uniref:5-formyltetrahydrofolate cyclo-ligase n=1 Tax=Streptomyces spiramenti TaxID=2720606 RepID=A0ABX1AMI1_9ACTN|nr:5-formyltetrahydrofolate cyclo-ligase [Streptomyces spiramenti]NJP66285.1 5-formyltetrahydrofolate cyclo-ligase [Streptomyces spiramenti]
MAIAARKREVRRDLLAVRAAMADDELEHAGEALAEQALAVPELATAGTVAAYVAVGHEPETRPLLEALRARGTRVLLPVLLPDDDLDWARYDGAAELAEAEHPGRIRLYEPAGERLGTHAVTEADVVLLPGLAVDGRGIRIGRGGGSYDRVLARLAISAALPDDAAEAADSAARTAPIATDGALGQDAAGGPEDGPAQGRRPEGSAAGSGKPLLVAVVYGHEIVGRLPDEPHDQPVHAAVTPEGVHRFHG